MIPPNPMMQALEQSRQPSPVSSSGAEPPAGMPQPGQDDLSKCWSMIQDMNSKLDKIIEFISGKNTGKNPNAPQVEEDDGNDVKETDKNGSGY